MHEYGSISTTKVPLFLQEKLQDDEEKQGGKNRPQTETTKTLVETRSTFVFCCDAFFPFILCERSVISRVSFLRQCVNIITNQAFVAVNSYYFFILFFVRLVIYGPAENEDHTLADT